MSVVDVMQTWEKARIASGVAFYQPGGGIGDYKTISLANRVTTNLLTEYEARHAINKYNAYVIEKPPKYSFTIAVASLSEEAALLRDVQSSGIYFRLRVGDENADPVGNREFQLGVEYFNFCKLTKRVLEIPVADAPTVIYEGIALEFSYSFWKKNGDEYSLDNVVDEKGNQLWFGHGTPISSNANLFANWAKLIGG